MCNLFVSLRPPSSRFSLILLSLRDEVLSRPTAGAAWRNGILSGIDLQDPAKGTWFGVNEKGQIGILLSITQKREYKRSDVISRGGIVHDFLQSNKNGVDFCDSLIPSVTNYNGFTFVAIDRSSDGYNMHSVTNALVNDVRTLHWDQGPHVVGNCPPHATYGKLTRGKMLFNEFLQSIDDNITDYEIADKLLDIGNDKVECWPDPQLQSQVNEFDARGLSSIFIRYGGNPPIYGTRSQTALIVSRDGNAFLRERRLISIEKNGNEDWETHDFSFNTNN